MSDAEYSLVKALMKENDNLRIIAVGDDDQNIYEFRGSSSTHFESLLNEPESKKYELVDNYRSNANIVEFANQFADSINHRFKTIPIAPIKKENGKINICKLSSENIVIPVVNIIQKINPSGSTCIIVRTNEEALNIVGLLNKNGIIARKLQTNNDFNLYNLVEIRDFIYDINKNNNSYVITDEIWQQAKNDLNKRYNGSNNLASVQKLIGNFEETNSKTKYKSDFMQFVRESKLEDFISTSEGYILVSTIHQTKGREFDNVFLAISRSSELNDARKREIYVAITRAKQNLHILYNGGHFDKINVENIERTTDNNSYPMPEQITLQLSHKDVILSYFACRKREISSLVSGGELSIREESCFIGDTEVLKFSSKFCNQINDLKKKGYFPSKVTVRHVVFWQGKDKEEEIKIILPDVEFSKR
jgi:ATP-dependent DNA helicase RecQ